MAERVKPTREQLAARIKQQDSDALNDLYEETETLVDARLEDAWRPVPDAVYRLIFLRVGFALWDASKSSNGTGQQMTMEGQQPVRAARDPFISSAPLLANYVRTFA